MWQTDRGTGTSIFWFPCDAKWLPAIKPNDMVRWYICSVLCICMVSGRERKRNIHKKGCSKWRHYYCYNFCSLAKHSFPQPQAELRRPLVPLKALEPRNFWEILPLYCNCGNLFYKKKNILITLFPRAVLIYNNVFLPFHSIRQHLRLLI